MSREIHFYGNKGTPANGGEMAWWSGLKMVKHTHTGVPYLCTVTFSKAICTCSVVIRKTKKKKLPACLMLLKKNVHDLIGGIQQSVRS